MTVTEGTGTMSFGKRARERQARFREQSLLPVFPVGRRHGHLLASGYEDGNLFPTLRGDNGARRFFEIRNIRWWQDTRNGDNSAGKRPIRNMASSQVVCVNFLLPLTEVPEALSAMLRAVDDDVMGVVPIEGGDSHSPIELGIIYLSAEPLVDSRPRFMNLLQFLNPTPIGIRGIAP